MADTFINLAWLLLEPKVRSLKYISFGLGQAKLELEHRRAEIGKRELTSEQAILLDEGERWIDTQRANFLQDVDLGKWSGLSVRQMAEEAGCLHFYNLVYTPFSACAHSMWHHVARYNLIKYANPLHRYHRRPVSPALDPDIHYFYRAAKYWAKSLDTFDQCTGIHVSCRSSYDALVAAINVKDAPKQHST